MNNKQLALEIRDLTIEFHTYEGVVEAVNSLNLQLERGTALGLVGETGAGKTTTALACLQLIQMPPGKITGGEIFLNGENILKKSEQEMEKIRGNSISMIFQDPMTSLNPVMKVEDQIQESILLHQDVDRAEAMLKTRAMLELVGIPSDRGCEYPHQFSGGMKQRVVIAIALACNPSVLLADEPTTALDVTIQAQVLDMMKGLVHKSGTSLLMITHDLGVVAEICDYVAIMYGGEIIEYGSLDDIFNNRRHPYTEGLFNSLPDIENRSVELKPIAGLMPDPYNLPTGCTFHPRCPYVQEFCSSSKPKAQWRSARHYVKCHLYDEKSVVRGGILENE